MYEHKGVLTTTINDATLSHVNKPTTVREILL